MPTKDASHEWRECSSLSGCLAMQTLLLCTWLGLRGGRSRRDGDWGRGRGHDLDHTPAGHVRLCFLRLLRGRALFILLRGNVKNVSVRSVGRDPPEHAHEAR